RAAAQPPLRRLPRGISGVRETMSYRNDPYDPKQASLLSPESLGDAVEAAGAAFAAAADLDALGALKPAHLGDRSPISLARREIGSLPPAAQADPGKRGKRGPPARQA